MPQQETNSTHGIGAINDEVCRNRTQISFPVGYFGSTQTLAFSLCESLWCVFHQECHQFYLYQI